MVPLGAGPAACRRRRRTALAGCWNLAVARQNALPRLPKPDSAPKCVGIVTQTGSGREFLLDPFQMLGVSAANEHAVGLHRHLEPLHHIDHIALPAVLAALLPRRLTHE